MDFDTPKVYGDTSITDGLVVVVIVHALIIVDFDVINIHGNHQERHVRT